MREREKPWGRSIAECEKDLLNYLYAVPQTFHELRELVPWMNSLALKCALKNLERKGLAVYLRASEGGPGWVLAARSV